MDRRQRRKGAGLLWGWGGEWKWIFHSWKGRKGQRVGASLGSTGMSHQGPGEWRVDRVWRPVMLGSAGRR